MVLRPTLTRRSLFAGSAAALAASALPRPSWAAEYPFALGVASGNPGPEGVVLWTRLAPEPLSPDPERPGGMPPQPLLVRWEVAEDPGMQRVVQRGETQA